MPERRAIELLRAAEERGLTIAVAESLTGGLVCDALVSVPGASRTLRGGVVAYWSEVKADVLGVDAKLLVRVGPVHAEVARQMALGAARRLGASLGIATTGVAGPGAQDGTPPGTVVVASVLVDDADAAVVRSWRFEGDRGAVRRKAVDAALDVALEAIAAGGHRAG